MRPKAQRSRACNQCLERRVKCDETPEVCRQCTRLGLKCSGPLQGSIIINMTERVTKPRQRKKREVRAAVVVREDHATKKTPAIPHANFEVKPERIDSPPLQVVHHPRRKFEPIERPQREWENAIAAIRFHHKLPTLYQPDQAHNLDLAFTSHFVELNKGVRPNSPEIPWITHLPTFQSKASKPALKLSIRATAMAFYANVHGDPAIMVDSYKWYTVSLSSQRMALSKMNGKTIPTDEEVLVPIVLGLYEVYAGTTPANVFQHLTAATKIIEMRGPHNCSSGVISPLFKAMRVSDAHRAMIFNQPSLFSTKPWMTIPFIIQPRNAHQYLADILLAIPDCIALCNMGGSMSQFFSRPIPAHTNLLPVRQRTNELLHRLNEWADNHPHLTRLTPDPLIVTLDMGKQVRGSVSMTTGTQDAPAVPTVVLPDTFIALTAATYEAVRLILSLLLHKISPTPPPPSESSAPAWPATPPYSILLSTATASARMILEIATILESTHPVGFDFMRSVFPLVVVAILGPREEEKGGALGIIERWGESRGVGGLCGAWINA